MDSLINLFSSIGSSFTKFFTLCKVFFQNIIDFLGNIGSIFSALWFGLKSLLSGVSNLISELFNGSFFDYLFDGFNSLSQYIGLTGSLFILSFFSVIILRIIIGFVFKIFKLDISYKVAVSYWRKK